MFQWYGTEIHTIFVSEQMCERKQNLEETHFTKYETSFGIWRHLYVPVKKGPMTHCFQLRHVF